MADAFYGEIRILPFIFAPQNWLWCDGSLLPVQQYQALFSLVSNLYGGDARTTFGVPNLTDKAAACMTVWNDPVWGAGKSQGANGVTLAQAQLPLHNHTVAVRNVTTNAALYSASTPAGNYLSSSWKLRPGSTTAYELMPLYTAPGTPNSTLPASTIGINSASPVTAQPHENRQPFLAMNFCIAAQDAFYPEFP